ncbi:transcriptional regulator, AraC family [Methylobacterium sp. 4-46]|uniref:AraC family transcriptional regulator n=1 Tax=unclassified Methylobacterium TaxID=2615210 RepID=UPI000152E13C|nr:MULTISPECIES: AraC family transcriptional regulator [Methylobacterium]ACA15817.1 transcriptional regulator, AraC family [Methylobacterium sp. 4-46]WFT81545.1 AraC family transcriptional regulator [Methylobacterium nodulans]
MSEALEIAYGDFGRVALLDMDRGLVRHAHPHCHVLLKVEGDDTQFLVGERVVSLTDMQAVLVNAWETHAYLHDPRREPAMILALYIEPAWLGAFRHNWSASGAPGFFHEPAGQVTAPIRALVRDLAAEMVYAPGSRRVRDELLPGLMIALIERFTKWREIGTSLREASRSARGDWRVRRAIARMRGEEGLGLGADALAREAGLSRAHFYRLFERTTGASPHVFLNAIRVERAVEAIVGGDESLADLGTKLGFSAPAHFSRFFRDHVSVPPSVFRTIVRRTAACAA